MATIRRYFAVIGVCAAALFAPQVARAQTTACTNDVDCPDAACGGQICDWSTNPHSCKPAGTYPQGQDGWCTSTSDCKCNSEGATCAGVQCTQTLPKGGGTGGATSAGTGGGTSGGAAATAGATATATAGASSSAAGSAAGPSSSGDSSSSSGCSLSGGVPRGSLGFGLGAVCAAALIGARRRRRAA